VGKVDKLDYSVIYESTIKQYGLHVSEDQLRSVDIDGFFFDLDQICSEVDYFSTSSKFNYDNMSFTGDGYSLLKNDDKWVIYIADSIVGEVDYISPREKYEDEIKAYHLTLSDKELCSFNMSDLLFVIEKVKEKDTDVTSSLSYDKEIDTYTYEYYEQLVRHKYCFKGNGKGTYDILYNDEVIGSFKVKH
jgi:hypothetical protein